MDKAKKSHSYLGGTFLRDTISLLVFVLFPDGALHPITQIVPNQTDIDRGDGTGRHHVLIFIIHHYSTKNI